MELLFNFILIFRHTENTFTNFHSTHTLFFFFSQMNFIDVVKTGYLNLRIFIEPPMK